MSSYYALSPQESAALQRRLRARQLGSTQPIKNEESFFGKLVPDIAEDAAKQIGLSLLYTIPGLYHTASAITKDVGGTFSGDFDFNRTAEIGRLMGEGIVDDFRNPRENIGYLLMDLWGAASLGTGLAARAARGGSLAARAAGHDGLGGALAHIGGKIPPGSPMGIVPASMRPRTLEPFTAFSRARDKVSAAMQRARFKQEASRPGVDPRTAMNDVIGRANTVTDSRPWEPVPTTGRWHYDPERGPVPDRSLFAIDSDGGIRLNQPNINLFGEPTYGFPALRREVDAPDAPDTPIEGQFDFDSMRQLMLDDEAKAVAARQAADIAAAARQKFLDARAQRASLPTGNPTGWPEARPMKRIERLGEDRVRGRLGDLYKPTWLEAHRRRQIQGDDAPTPDYDSATWEHMKRADEAEEFLASIGHESYNLPPSAIQFRPNKNARRIEAYYEGVRLPVSIRIADLEGKKAAFVHDDRPTVLKKVGGYYATLEQAKKAARHYAGQEGFGVFRKRQGQSKPDVAPDAPKPVNPADNITGRQKTAAKQLLDQHPDLTLVGGKPVGLPVGRPGGHLIFRDKDNTRYMISGHGRVYRKDPDGRVYELADGKEIPISHKDDAPAPPQEKSEAPAAPMDDVVKEEPPAGTDVGVHWQDRLTDEQNATWERMRDEGKGLRFAEMTEAGDAVFHHIDDATKYEVISRSGDVIPYGKEAAAAVREARVAQQKIKKAKRAEDLKAVTPEQLAKVGVDETTLRMVGLTQRDLGISPTQLEKKGVPKAETKMLAGKLHSELKDLFKAVAEQGRRPTTAEMAKALANVTGDKKLAGKIVSDIMKAKGGAPVTTRDIMREFIRGFRENPAYEMKLSTKAVATDENLPGIHMLKKVEGSVPLSRNVVTRNITRTYYSILQSLDRPAEIGYGKKMTKGGNLANRALRRKIRFANNEAQRVVTAAANAGIATSMSDLRKTNPEAFDKAGRFNPVKYWDGLNQISQIGLLFLKPAYLPANLIGQAMLSLIDHSWNPINVAKAVRIQNEMFRDKALAGERAAKIRHAMGEGLIKSIDASDDIEKGKLLRGTQRTYEGFQKMYAKVLDTPFRDNAFITEAMRWGYKDADSIGKLVDSWKGEADHDFIRIAQRGNRNLIDYGRMSRREKQFVRRMIFFYPWIKGATIYGARYFAEHPVQGVYSAQSSKIGQERAGLGPVPSYLEGAFKVGERNVPGLGKMPTVVNPQAISILGTPAESLNMVRGLLGGEVRQSEQISELATPALRTALAAITRTDPFTGSKYKPGETLGDIAVDQLSGTLAPVHLVERMNRANQIESGERDARELLFPSDTRDAVGRFLGIGFGAAVGRPGGEFALNTRESSSRAAAEKRELATKEESVKLRYKSYRDNAREEAKRVGVKLPKEFDRALAVKAERFANIKRWEEIHGRKADQMIRLQSDLDLLVRLKKMKKSQADSLLKQYADLYKRAPNDASSEIESFRRDLGEAYFDQEILSTYKSILKDYGAKVDDF